jgi:hypothetical protein
MRKNAAERKDSDPRLNIPELKTAAQVGLSDLTCIVRLFRLGYFVVPFAFFLFLVPSWFGGCFIFYRHRVSSASKLIFFLLGTPMLA